MPGSPTYRQIRPDEMQSIFDVRVATWHNDREHDESLVPHKRWEGGDCEQEEREGAEMR